MPKKYTKKYLLDLTERVLWTAAEAGVAVVGLEALDLPTWAIAPVAAGLAFLKGAIARHISATGSASTAPGV